MLDDNYQWMDKIVISAATWFDSFFDNSRAEEENRSTAHLQLEGGWCKYEGYDFKQRLNFCLHLPGMDNRWNLLFSVGDDEDFEIDRYPGGSSRREDEANTAAALQYFLLQSERMNISSTTGLSYNYAYAGIRYRGSYEYDSWKGRFVSYFRYYINDGFESINEFDLERRVSEHLLFRTTFNGDWCEK